MALLRLGETTRRFAQAAADTLAEFLGRRIGEGHHEDFRRAQRPAESVLAAMVEDQAYV